MKKLDKESIYRIDAELKINGNRLGLRRLEQQHCLQLGAM